MPSLSSSLNLGDLCILRLSALGDVCNLVPAVRALQKQQPGIKITWVIGRAEYNLLAGLEGVDFFIYDKKSGLAGMRALRKEIMDKRAGKPFDVLLHMQAALRASVLSRFIPAKRRIGFDAARAKDNQNWFVNEQINANPNVRVGQGFMDFVHYLGVAKTEPEWSIPVPEADQAVAKQLVAGLERYLVISPCSSFRKRNWRNWEDFVGWAEVIDYAQQAYGLTTVLVGGQTELEKNATAQIIKHSQSKILDLMGKTNLKALLAVIDGAELVIAPDSGPIHMAAARGKPALGLYATSNPARTGPWLDDYVVNRYPEAVAKYLKQPLETVAWGQRVRSPNAMGLITSQDVIEKLDLIAADLKLKKLSPKIPTRI
ncbi:glycosyltransferase family 9 protein [Marinospirillum insulare]|uniref:Glycosyl transferase n=1 Tax=Marinospirillum insulare TaxID=217169 RepID=A0ABQ6A424_9GAMM|nr:glycosyltransferase family 9 protein [Marinospirillum insulare]GLR64859.1 glycosyl transferase [Marinospirillum insulare]